MDQPQARRGQRALDRGDVIELRYRGVTARMPVFIVPGQPDQSVTVFLGYGRRMAGRVGTATERRPAIQRLLAQDVGCAVVRQRTRDRQDRRPLSAGDDAGPPRDGRTAPRSRGDARAVQAATPGNRAHMAHTSPKTLTLYPEHEFIGNKWGMSIDLDLLHGLRRLRRRLRRREQHPGRRQGCRSASTARCTGFASTTTSRGDLDHPDTLQSVHQPVPCQQCENAPCEVVCPVAATTHSSEGLNDMVYNRCVGHALLLEQLPLQGAPVQLPALLRLEHAEPLAAAQSRRHRSQPRRHGEVHRTACSGSTTRASTRRRTDRDIRDGEIVTACEAVCPADAIVFGNLNDPNSRVSKLKAQQRNYGVLEELNTRPRTTYLASLRNPNPELEPQDGRAHDWTLMDSTHVPRSSYKAPPPVIEPGHTFESITSKISSIVLTKYQPISWVVTTAIGSCSSTSSGVGRLPVPEGHRDLGQQHSGRLGVRHHQLRLVDRHRPRRHAHLGDSAAAQAGLADVDQPVRRGDDALRGRLRA